jgi:glutamate racemase
MRFALVDSGLGVLPAAMHLRRLWPDADLVLSMDPEGMPWGPRTPDDIADRALACAQATLPWNPDVLVLACNTASVRALDVLRGELEPDVPVVGTVPAIKPAAAGGEPVAIWATAATTGSPYQRNLIRQFTDGVRVTEVACPGLADAIEAADKGAITAAVAAAACLTPPDARAVVLGCTQYELAMDRIRSALPRVRLHGSAAAVAAQAVRRTPSRLAASSGASAASSGASAAPADTGAPGSPGSPAVEGASASPAGQPELHVLLSGRPGELPAAALHYAEGRLLAGLRLPSPAA